jgi:hypothetical protein
MVIAPLDKPYQWRYSYVHEMPCLQESFMTAYIRIALVIVAGATLFGCATTAKNAQPAVSAAVKDPTCLTDTGSRINGTAKCRGIGRSYSNEDLERTGYTSTADALAVLDPAVTVHH